MGKKILKEIEISEIINLYSSGRVSSTHKLARLFKVGHKKISNILKENGILINKKGGQIKNGGSDIITNTKVIKKTPGDGCVFIAICNITEKQFNDYDNRGGGLTTHLIKLGFDVDIPTNSYQRKKYYIEHGKQWFEEYFTIIETEIKNTRKCKICGWGTFDIKNKTGAFTNHVNNIHTLKIHEYLEMFPEDIKYHPTYVSQKKRKKFLNNPDDMVKCEICGEKLKVISNTHLKTHGITGLEYKLKYGGKLMSTNLTDKTAKRLNNYNLNGKTKGKPSKPELEISGLLDSWGIEYQSGNRKILNGKEIDILIENKKIGIEYNGNIHHTEFFGKKGRNYHLSKTVGCSDNGYQLIQIFSDEWINHRDIVISKLKHILGVSDAIKIGARKCTIETVSINIKNNFLDANHIQGKDSSTIKLGAYYNMILVGVMTFKIKNGNAYELTRFATDNHYSVSGLGSKLLKHFITNYDVSNIISFADRRWTLNPDDNLYTKAGFNLVKILPPDYRYYHLKDRTENRSHKFGFRKQILVNKYPKILNLVMTETEMIKKLGYDKIWDCGLFKYELVINSS